MLELSPSQYPLVRSLFEEMDFHLPLAAILARDVSAPIYVDALDSPRYALTWTGHRFYLTGAPAGEGTLSAARHVFREIYRPMALARGGEVYGLYPSPAWAGVIESLVGDLTPIREERQYYALKENRCDWRAMLPEGFELCLVDTELLAEKRIKNPEYLTEEMLSERASVDEFLQKSFGVCLVHADEIVGWCLSEYNTGDRCEVGIATREDFRRRGFATLMATALIELARSRGVRRVGWHCYTDNLPSAATARKAGFEKIADYPVCFGWFNPALHLANQGYVALRQEQYAEALAFYEQGMALGEVPGWACWGAACAAACLGQADKAFHHLYLAVDGGFCDLERLQSSPHLTSLHGSSAWQALLERLGKPPQLKVGHT